MQPIAPEKIMEFTILGHPYVKKSNQRAVINRRTGKIVRVNTPRYKEWHYTATQQMMGIRKPAEPIDYPINLQCKFFMQTNGRVDLSALYEGIQDVLVEVGVLADDNWKIVASHDGSGVEWDKFSPRMEITITKKEIRP